MYPFSKRLKTLLFGFLFIGLVNCQRSASGSSPTNFQIKSTGSNYIFSSMYLQRKSFITYWKLLFKYFSIQYSIQDQKILLNPCPHGKYWFKIFYFGLTNLVQPIIHKVQSKILKHLISLTYMKVFLKHRLKFDILELINPHMTFTACYH